MRQEQNDMISDIKLYDVLYLTAKNALKFQDESGAFPPGHNGVRFDPETPVRNTSHWLITMLKVYSYSKEEVFKESAIKALNYLLRKEARPMGATFWHRKKPEKDFCNGLMGQAYTIESLAIAYKELGINNAKIVSEEVFLMHPFDEKTGLWQRVSVDGSYLSADGTFNHQLWFAASGALLWKYGGNIEVNRRVTVFMANLNINMKLYKIKNKGLIKHPLLRNLSNEDGKFNKFILLRTMLRQIKEKETKHAIGYHMFNLYALSLLKSVYPNHLFWETRKCKMILKYMISSDYLNIAENPSFSTPYSPAGFETSFVERAFALETFYPSQNNIDELERLIKAQIIKTYDFNSHMMSKCTADSQTQAARIYKATRLPNITISI